MSLQDVIHQIVLEKGPMLPAEIVREVNIRTGQTTDMFFAGAILSELMGAKLVKMSYAKIGGSRVYYCKGQEPKLVKLYDYLSEKHKKAYDILEKKQVVRASSLEPVIRVAMQDLKDFAVPLDVKLKEQETFFKWFLLPMDDVQALVKTIMQTEIDTNDTQKHSQEKKTEQKKSESEPLKQESKTNTVQQKTSPALRKSSAQSDGFILSNTRSVQQKTNTPVQKNQTSQSTGSLLQSKPESSEKQFTLSGSEETQDIFVQKALNFFQKNNIDIKKINVLRKESEAEFEGKVKSQIGGIYYYFFVKSKKKISETDLSYAYVRAQNKQLPLCYLSPGDLTKKAVEILETDLKSANFLKM